MPATRHPDHFSKVIFDIAAEHGDTVLLLSSDIWRKRVPEELKGAAVFLKPDTVWEDDVLKAETFRSTVRAWLIGVRWTATPFTMRET